MKSGMVIVNYNDYETTIKLINNVKDYKIIEEYLIHQSTYLWSSFQLQ